MKQFAIHLSLLALAVCAAIFPAYHGTVGIASVGLWLYGGFSVFATIVALLIVVILSLEIDSLSADTKRKLAEAKETMADVLLKPRPVSQTVIRIMFVLTVIAAAYAGLVATAIVYAFSGIVSIAGLALSRGIAKGWSEA